MIRTELVSVYNLKEEKPKVVISVPAYFNIVQRRATEAASKMAGLEVLRVVNELTAGAFAYALHESMEEDTYVLVYDFGGGTFDCTKLMRQNVDGCTRMQVTATKGNPILGGENIDEQIALHFLSKAKEILRGKSSSEFLESESTLMVDLRQLACEVKEKMTKKSLNSYKVKFSVNSSSNNISFEFTLPELQDIVDPFFNGTEEMGN